MSAANVYLVDDDTSFLASLKDFLEAAGWQVRAFDSAESFRRSAPDLPRAPLFLDVRMPKSSGIDHLTHFPHMAEAYPTIIITGHGDIDLAVQALKLGAVDFLEKPFRPERLLLALRGAAAALAKSAEQSSAHVSEELACLTKREREVVMGLAEGKPNKVVAHDLCVSIRTVEMHRANAMAKLGVKNSAALLRKVIKADMRQSATGPVGVTGRT